MPAYRLRPARTVTDKSGRQMCVVLGPADGHDDLSVAWMMLPAGCRRNEERHEYTEVVIVLSGKARVTMDGKPEDVGAGHSIYVPRGAVWQLENTGREPLVCYSICSPASPPGSVH